jgi:hypothetical protein
MRTAVASLLVLAAVALNGATPAPAGSAGAERASGAAVTDLSAQSAVPRRARTRIRVTPARRLVRECSFRLVREVRASGTYVVPHQRCWWAPAR